MAVMSGVNELPKGLLIKSGYSVKEAISYRNAWFQEWLMSQKYGSILDQFSQICFDRLEKIGNNSRDERFRHLDEIQNNFKRWPTEIAQMLNYLLKFKPNHKEKEDLATMVVYAVSAQDFFARKIVNGDLWILKFPP